MSSRVHSRYTRTLSDLPAAGRRVVITVSVRRVRCVGPECRTKVFAERLEPDLAAAYARRTGRLETIVHHLGLALGGRPAESFARRLMVPASRETMLRTVRRRAQRPAETLNMIGIDDWAFRRGHRYGTLICDLERRCVVAHLTRSSLQVDGDKPKRSRLAIPLQGLPARLLPHRSGRGSHGGRAALPARRHRPYDQVRLRRVAREGDSAGRRRLPPASH